MSCPIIIQDIANFSARKEDMPRHIEYKDDGSGWDKEQCGDPTSGFKVASPHMPHWRNGCGRLQVLTTMRTSPQTRRPKKPQ
eukprot:5735609-Amphidinium_carterae.1